ncbi:unnamed protein product [Schistocephalus solidus]|uniref:SH2 domain-containing protein n=1 Tax=Schistocephalus solidus TaxID=70667 RepID=A0A183SJK8_SCHSO|nr:unnamed protein product [Schistocephalus solidus]
MLNKNAPVFLTVEIRLALPNLQKRLGIYVVVMPEGKKSGLSACGPYIGPPPRTSRSPWFFLLHTRIFLTETEKACAEEGVPSSILQAFDCPNLASLSLVISFPPSVWSVPAVSSSFGAALPRVRDGETVKHYRIRSRASRSNTDICRYYISRQLPFVSLQQLVEHYMKNQSGLCCQLTAVCLRPSQPVPVGLSHNLVDKWEISKSSIVLKERIGKGQFGEVYRAVWNGTTIVAVKTLRASKSKLTDTLVPPPSLTPKSKGRALTAEAVCIW